jgi:hypothetical protein
MVSGYLAWYLALGYLAWYLAWLSGMVIWHGYLAWYNTWGRDEPHGGRDEPHGGRDEFFPVA